MVDPPPGSGDDAASGDLVGSGGHAGSGDPASIVARYERDGFAFPVDVIDRGHAADLVARLERFEEEHGSGSLRSLKGKAHLPFPWLQEVVADERLLDLVECIVGPDILCWGSTLWVKEPGSPGYAGWHQDARYLGLDPPITCSLWLALTDSTVESGCVRFVPGSHHEMRAHSVSDDAANMLAARQDIDGIDPSQAVPVELRAGQGSLHHEMAVHGSEPNRSAQRRIGLNVHYIPPTVRHHGLQGGTAQLLRGTDTVGHWGVDPVPAPGLDLDTELLDHCLAAHEWYVRRTEEALERSTHAGPPG